MPGVGVTVNIEVACPAALHPKCGAVGTCPGSCLERVINPDVHGLFEGSSDVLSFLAQYILSTGWSHLYLYITTHFYRCCSYPWDLPKTP